MHILLLHILFLLDLFYEEKTVISVSKTLLFLFFASLMLPVRKPT